MAEEKKRKFKCKNCQNTVETTNYENGVPECCDVKMEEVEVLPPCRMSSTAEHARPDEPPEPCDDGREGKI